MHGIIEQVLQHFLKPIRIAAHRWQPGRELYFQGDLLGLGLQLRRNQTGFDQVAQRNRAELEIELSGLNARELEQILREASQPGGMVANDLNKTAAVCGIVQRAAQQAFPQSPGWR